MLVILALHAIATRTNSLKAKMSSQNCFGNGKQCFNCASKKWSNCSHCGMFPENGVTQSEHLCAACIVLCHGQECRCDSHQWYKSKAESQKQEEGRSSALGVATSLACGTHRAGPGLGGLPHPWLDAQPPGAPSTMPCLHQNFDALHIKDELKYIKDELKELKEIKDNLQVHESELAGIKGELEVIKGFLNQIAAILKAGIVIERA